LAKNKIIVVEDEGIVAMDISKCLTGLGYDVVFVSDSGEKTLKLLDENKADLILMDVELKGGLNGIETAKLINEKMDIPIVFLTAFEDEATMNKLKEVSPYGYLVKPFDDEDLKRTVSKILS